MLETIDSTTTDTALANQTEKHRSFQLTTTSDEFPDTLRSSIGFSLVPQVVLFFVCAFLLDGGLFLNRVIISCVGYWVLVVIFMIRRRKNLTLIDLALIKWSYLGLFAIVNLVWAVGWLVMNAFG